MSFHLFSFLFGRRTKKQKSKLYELMPMPLILSQTRPNHTTYDNFNKVMSKEGNSHKFLALTAFFWSEKWQFIFRDGTFLKWITRSTSNVAPSWQSRKYSPTFLKYSSWSRVFSFSCFTACFADLVHWLYRKCATYGPINCQEINQMKIVSMIGQGGFGCVLEVVTVSFFPS